MAYTVRNLPPEPDASMLAAVREDPQTVKHLALWAIALICLVTLAGPLADFSAFLGCGF